MFIVRGKITIEQEVPRTVPRLVTITRPCLRASVVQNARRAAHAGKDLFAHGNGSGPSSIDEESSCAVVSKQLLPGDCFGISEFATGRSQYKRIVVTSVPCWIVEVPTSDDTAVAWAMQVAAVLREREKGQWRMDVA